VDFQGAVVGDVVWRTVHQFAGDNQAVGSRDGFIPGFEGSGGVFAQVEPDHPARFGQAGSQSRS
jgi:hypothetical protein